MADHKLTKDIKVGEKIPFGKGDALWRVLQLDEQTGKVLVIADNCVAEKPFHNKKRVTWENSLLREWLNTDYLNETFSKSEQAAIQETKVITPHEGATHDRIFLLS